MQRLESYTPYQFALFRIGLGLLILFCLVPMLWHGTALFSDQSMVANPELNWTYGYLYNPLDTYDSPAVITAVIASSIIFALGFTFGVFRRTSALLLYVGWTCLFNRNNFINHPGISFVGWLLLASTLVPLGEPLSLGARSVQLKDDWFMPRALFVGAWLVMAFSYTLSGVLKAASPSWIDGTAIYYVVRTANTYQWWFADWLRDLPLPFWKLMNWGTLALEILFLPLCLFSRGRMIASLGMVGLHVGIATFFDFIELTLSLMVVHFFTFDSRWFSARKVSDKQPIIFYDGVCGLCDGFVQFVHSEDVSRVFKLAPLQGETARELLGDDANSMHSIILVDETGKRFERSAAVLRILSWMGGLWWFARVCWIIPGFIRDAIYRLVAHYRYSIFGKYDACKLPSDKDKARFLD